MIESLCLLLPPGAQVLAHGFDTLQEHIPHADVKMAIPKMLLTA